MSDNGNHQEREVTFGVRIGQEGQPVQATTAGSIVVETIGQALAETPQAAEIAPNDLVSAVARDFTTGRLPQEVDDSEVQKGPTWQQALWDELDVALRDGSLTRQQLEKIVTGSTTFKQFKDSWVALRDKKERP